MIYDHSSLGGLTRPMYIPSNISFWFSVKKYFRKSTQSSNFDHFFFKKYVFILREKEHNQGRGRERGRERIPSRLHTVSTELDTGLEPTNHKIMTGAEIKSWTLN